MESLTEELSKLENGFEGLNKEIRNKLQESFINYKNEIREIMVIEKTKREEDVLKKDFEKEVMETPEITRSKKRCFSKGVHDYYVETNEITDICFEYSKVYDCIVFDELILINSDGPIFEEKLFISDNTFAAKKDNKFLCISPNNSMGYGDCVGPWQIFTIKIIQKINSKKYIVDFISIHNVPRRLELSFDHENFLDKKIIQQPIEENIQSNKTFKLLNNNLYTKDNNIVEIHKDSNSVSVEFIQCYDITNIVKMSFNRGDYTYYICETFGSIVVYSSRNTSKLSSKNHSPDKITCWRISKFGDYYKFQTDTGYWLTTNLNNRICLTKNENESKEFIIK